VLTIEQEFFEHPIEWRRVMRIVIAAAPAARIQRGVARRPSAVRDRAPEDFGIAMTCDLPVVSARNGRGETISEASGVCRPTGRSERSRVRPDRQQFEVRQGAARVRSDDSTRVSEQVRIERASDRSAVTARSNTRGAATVYSAAVERRRRWMGALLVGGALAAMVWLMAIVGGGLQDAGTPASPAATEVVYVRSGESLTALAARIAPELPAAGVIAQVRALNSLESSGLRVGQALVVPDYR